MHSIVTVLIMTKGQEGVSIYQTSIMKDKVNLYYSYTTWLSYSAYIHNI